MLHQGLRRFGANYSPASQESGLFGDKFGALGGESIDASPLDSDSYGFLAGLETADKQSLRVSAADKLHNARALVADLRREGPGTLTRFNAPPVDQLWYYQSLADVLARRLPGMLSAELTATCAEMIRLADSSIASTPD